MTKTEKQKAHSNPAQQSFDVTPFTVVCLRHTVELKYKGELYIKVSRSTNDAELASKVADIAQILNHQMPSEPDTITILQHKLDAKEEELTEAYRLINKINCDKLQANEERIRNDICIRNRIAHIEEATEMLRRLVK